MGEKPKPVENRLFDVFLVTEGAETVRHADALPSSHKLLWKYETRSPSPLYTSCYGNVRRAIALPSSHKLLRVGCLSPDAQLEGCNDGEQGAQRFRAPAFQTSIVEAQNPVHELLYGKKYLGRRRKRNVTPSGRAWRHISAISSVFHRAKAFAEGGLCRACR